ncbi:MAG: hypothetical protein AAFV98_17140 [Chloroflexota bacterium]
MLTQRKIFWFWLPLAFSFLLMIFEGPWIQGVMSRQDDAATQLAAFGIVVGLVVLIETPVIMFLAVGSALAKDRQAYRVLSRYVLIANVLLTIVHALMAFTPLLDFYLGVILDIPPELIEETRRPALILMFFTWFIGYRRFHQGILINHGRTRTITIGTVIRVIVSAGVAVGLGIWGDIPGAEIGAWSLISAVFVEMIYVHFISRQDVAQLEATKRKADIPPLTLRKVAGFHLPLAATAAMSWFVLPMTQRGLAQAENAVDVLAAYPIIFSIMMVMRSGGFAWQEAVIALNKGIQEQRALRRFTLYLGFGSSLILVLFAITPAIDYYLRTILDIPANLIPVVINGTIFAAFLPLFSTLQSYLRALLMKADNTNPIYQAMTIGFLTTIACLFFGIWLGLPAIPVAICSLTFGVGLELGYLWRALLRVDVQPFMPALAT